MLHTKDHKTINIFDPLDHLGRRRRKLLEQSWAPIFRKEILPQLPVKQLTPYYSGKREPRRKNFTRCWA